MFPVTSGVMLMMQLHGLLQFQMNSCLAGMETFLKGELPMKRKYFKAKW